MVEFIFLVVFLICLTFFVIGAMEMSMGVSIDYWSDKQYRLWKLICIMIGAFFLIAIIVLCIVSEERFSAKMLKLTFVLVLAAYILMGLFIIILHIIAWIGTCKIIEIKLRNYLTDKDLNSDKNKILDEFMSVNQGYSKKAVSRIFKKIISKNINVNL